MTTCISDFIDFPFSIIQNSRENALEEGHYRIDPVGPYIFPLSPSDKGSPMKYGSPLIRYQNTSQTCYSEPHKNARSTTFTKVAALASITLFPSVRRNTQESSRSIFHRSYRKQWRNLGVKMREQM